MQAQTQMSKGELLFEMEGKTLTRGVREITPHGVRLESNGQSQISGKFNGSEFGTLYSFNKLDGTSEWESKSILTSREGDMVIANARGTGRMSSPTTVQWQGEVFLMTQSPKLSLLNNTKAWIEGTGDLAQQTYHGRIYAKK